MTPEMKRRFTLWAYCSKCCRLYAKVEVGEIVNSTALGKEVPVTPLHDAKRAQFSVVKEDAE